MFCYVSIRISSDALPSLQFYVGKIWLERTLGIALKEEQED